MTETLRVPFGNVPVMVRAHGPLHGPVVLFAHAFPLHGAFWEAQLEACADAGFRAAAVDAPGFGGSPALGRALGMDDLAQILALALDALSSPRAVLAGCSMGGYATMAFARLFPFRLAGAALICTKATPDTPEGRERRETQALLALDKGAKSVTSEFVPKLVHPANAAALVRAQELAEAATAQGIADALRGMGERPDSLPSLRAWTAPGLVIAGEHDQLMTAADTDALAAAIPRGKKRVVPGAGHLAPIERPGEVNELLLGLLTACQSANAWSRRASERRPVELP